MPMKINTEGILHILRNPFGFDGSIIRESTLQAADKIEVLQKKLAEAENKIEEWKKDYIALRDWVGSKGIDITAYNNTDKERGENKNV